MNKNIGIKYGLLAGSVTVAYFLLFYFIQDTLILHPAVIWCSLMIYLGFMFKACMDESKGRETFNFQQALQTAFVVYIIASVVYYIFYYIWFNFVDPSLLQVQVERILARKEEIMNVMGPDEGTKYLQKLEKEGVSLTLSDLFLAFSQSLIGGFLLALIVAGFTRKS